MVSHRTTAGLFPVTPVGLAAALLCRPGGGEAWRQGEVPHYVTSNPTMAMSYADIVYALWRDQQRLVSTDTSCDAPLTICELGAGSGRFAFHFLTRLAHLCAQTNLELTSFRYVVTDQAERNLAFWEKPETDHVFGSNEIVSGHSWNHLSEGSRSSRVVPGSHVLASPLAYQPMKQ